MTLAQAYGRASKRLRRKMEYSISLLRKAEKLALAYDTRGGYYLAFSGGKDSQALIHIAQLAGVQFEGHMNLTSVDPPEVIRFVKREYPEVELIKPKDSIYHVALRKQLLPTKKVRWCCEEFKEKAGAGKVTLIGIRHQESRNRAKRNEVEISNYSFSGDLKAFEKFRKEKLSATKSPSTRKKGEVNITNAKEEKTIGCISGKETLLISPIIHWTERDVWEFLNKVVQVPHCELYDQGFTRIGCICCPMSPPRQKTVENERWPHVRRNWIKAIIAIRSGGGYCKERLPQQTLWYGIGKDWKPIRWGKDRRLRVHPTSRPEPLESGFSDCSSPDGLTDEQEQEIAGNIFDWWISGKAYKKWYAEKFLQYELEFKGWL